MALDDRTRAMLHRVLGSDILEALEHPRTIEIALNPDGSLWVESLGARLRRIGHRDEAAATSIVRTIAGAVGKELNARTPLLECELPLDGSRVSAQVPPVVEGPSFTLRKRASQIFTIPQYVEAGTMTQAQADTLLAAVANHRNILVIGGTGTGKTTLVNAIIHAMVEHDPDERLVIIEDTRELQCAAADSVRYKTAPDLNIHMTQLLRTTLRMRPDRILVGEVRGPEALDLLMAWNTGHEGGVATLHADHCLAGLSRLAMLVSMNPEAPRQIEPLIAEAVHVLVHIKKTPAGRRINEIREVHGFDTTYITHRSDSPCDASN